MKKLITVTVGVALCLTACAQSLIRPADQNADYGQAPTNYKDRIHEYWQSTLKDPGSLQVKSISAPEKAFIYSTITKDHSYDLYTDVEFVPVYGHRVCAIINAKNSYGGYVGWKPQAFFFDSTGRFIVPLFMTTDMLKGMHRKGVFDQETRITTDQCQ